MPFGPGVAEESDSVNYNTDNISITNMETMSRNSVETNGAALNGGDNISSMNLETMASNSVESNGAAENASSSNSGMNLNEVEKSEAAESAGDSKLGKIVLSKQNQSTV